MKNKCMIRIMLLVFLLVLIFDSSVRAGELTVTPESFDRYKPCYIKVDGKGDIWTSYFDLEGKIHIRNISRNSDIMLSESRGDIAGGLAFDVQGENVYVVWREKIGGKKKLYFRASHDGGKTLSEPILLDDDGTEALTRVKISSNSRGDVFIVWYGEKIIGNATHHIYSVSSNDFGRTFSDVKNLTLGYDHSIYPTLLVDESNAYIFSYSMKHLEGQTESKTEDKQKRIQAGKRYMVFRKTTDRGKTWSEPVEIKEIGVVTLFVEPVKVGERLYVFWFNSYDGVPVIENAYSDNGGKTWKTAVIEDTRGFDVGILKVAHDSKGHIYLAMSGKWEDGQKNKVYFIATGDNGDTWKKLTPLRHYPFEHTQAKDPDIISKDNGEVVVAWVDYRNIRSNIYIQYSKDYGRTWLERDIALEKPGQFNTALYPYAKNIVTINDRYYILAYRFENDLTLRQAKLLLLDFSVNGRGAK